MTAPLTGNLVHETTTDVGTGTLALTPYSQSFNDAFGNGATTDVYYYFIQHRTLAEWEWGTGHNSDPTHLVRDTVIQSSNGNAAVNFSAGTKDVCNDFPSFLTLDYANNRLGVGQTTPAGALHVAGPRGSIPQLLVENSGVGSGGQAAFVVFKDTGNSRSLSFFAGKGGHIDSQFTFEDEVNGQETLSLLSGPSNASEALMPSLAVWGWTNDPTRSDVSPDTGLSRISANVVGLGNGTQGDFSGTAKLTSIDLAGNITLDAPPSGGGPGALRLTSAATNTIFLLKNTSGGTTDDWEWGSGAGHQVYFFNSTQNITPFALLSDVGGPGAQFQVAAEGVFNWTSTSRYAGLGSADTGISRTAAGVVALGNGTQGDFSGTIKTQKQIVDDVSGGSFHIVQDITAANAPVTQWTDGNSTAWQLGPFQAGDGSFGFYNYQPSSNGGWTAFTDGSGANSKIWVAIGNDGTFGFGSAAGDPASLSVIDTGISRASVSAIAVGNGQPGDTSGTLVATITLLVPTNISALPGSPTQGMIAAVNDGDAALAWGATVVNSGAGATYYVVTYNGTNWTVMGK